MDVGSLTVSVRVKGIWRVKVACWLATRAFVLLNWSVRSLQVKVG